jgi:preprotein translocase subunit SecE
MINKKHKKAAEAPDPTDTWGKLFFTFLSNATAENQKIGVDQ